MLSNSSRCATRRLTVLGRQLVSVRHSPIYDAHGKATQAVLFSSATSGGDSDKDQGKESKGFSCQGNTGDDQQSFIDKAKAGGANMLLGLFHARSDRFDMCLKDMTVESIGGGEVTCSLKVLPELRNAYGTLHGGAISTIVDVVGTLALLGVDPTRAGVSVDLNVTFVRAAKADSTVIVVAKVTKVGRKLGFTEVELTDKETGKVIALGRHTKAL